MPYRDEPPPPRHGRRAVAARLRQQEADVFGPEVGFLERTERLFASEGVLGPEGGAMQAMRRVATLLASAALPAYVWLQGRSALPIVAAVAVLVLLVAPLYVLVVTLRRMDRLRSRGWWDHLLMTPVLPSLWSDFVLAKTLSRVRPTTRGMAHGIVFAVTIGAMATPPSQPGEWIFTVIASLPFYAFLFLPMTMYWSRMEYATRDAAEAFLYEALDRRGFEAWAGFATRRRWIGTLPTVAGWAISIALVPISSRLMEQESTMAAGLFLMMIAFLLPLCLEGILLQRERARERRVWPELQELGYEPGGFGPSGFFDEALADLPRAKR